MESTEYAPTATVTTLIRRQSADVFSAFVDPALITRFWLSRTCGQLEAGRTLHWEFMVKGASVETHVLKLEPSRRILIRWSDDTTVQWTFDEDSEGNTLVRIENANFRGTLEERVEAALEATQGFTIVLCDLKTLLESGKSMNLVRDKALLIEAAARR
jgi:uncharacterized protein YndB with AHSA1/START domain